jgi:hypothetical protein
MGTEYAYAGEIVKADKQADGTLMVYGVATDPSLDLDGQSCDPEWLKTAMPEWFKFGNIREQHGSVAAGVGKELSEDGNRWMLKAHVVDANTVRKVEAGVLKGFSIGVREGKVLRGKSAGAPNGKIVGGKIVEVSLVDRPCNPNATISICKAAPGGELEAVDPVLIDIDPSMYDEDGGPEADDFGVASGDDVDADGEPDDEQDSQVVDGAVDGDELDDAADTGELSLFDGLDVEWDDDIEPPAFTDTDGMFAKAVELHGEDIVKGLLEQLIHGSGKDGDGDGKTGEGKRRKGESEAEKRRRARAARDAEAERERKHRNRLDAERAQDANRASRAGRRMEAGEHRGRLGSYDKTLSLLEHRHAARLARNVLDGVIAKSADADVQDDAEIVAELSELVIAEAEALALGGADGPEDVSLLLDAVAAIAKMVGAEPTILKSAAPVLDGSSASATLDVAEIVKAQVAEKLSEVTKAHEVELAKLDARLTKMAATPLPGGPVIASFAMPSTPAQTSHITKALELERKAADPLLAPAVAEGYRALAQRERAAG